LAPATGSLLATPYVPDYDLVVLAAAIAFFVHHEMSRGFRTFAGIPLGLLMMPAVYVFTLRRAALDRELVSLAAGRHGIAQA
jgi:alpha-1,2-mannosyltransferase